MESHDYTLKYTLGACKEQPIVNLLLTSERINMDIECLAPLEGKKVLMMFGQTGVSKSTFANALISGSDGIGRDDEGNLIAKEDLKDANGKQVFKIGQGLISETSTPTFYMIDPQEEMFMVDAPGMCDSNVNKELPNIVSVQRVMRSCSIFQMVLLMNACSLDENRGAEMIISLTRILRFISM